MQCPKCRHSWKAVRKPKQDVAIHHLAEGEIHAGQLCWKCERRIDRGFAYAVRDYPVVVCPECIVSGEVWLPEEAASERHTLILSRVVGLLAGEYDSALDVERSVADVA